VALAVEYGGGEGLSFVRRPHRSPDETAARTDRVAGEFCRVNIWLRARSIEKSREAAASGTGGSLIFREQSRRDLPPGQMAY